MQVIYHRPGSFRPAVPPAPAEAKGDADSDVDGDDSGGWIDRDIELFHGEIEYQGKMQEAVKVRPLSPSISAADRAAITKKLDAGTAAKDDGFGGKPARKGKGASDMDDEIPF